MNCTCTEAQTDHFIIDRACPAPDAEHLATCRRSENSPAVGAPNGWPAGYLACGCRDDGRGRHVR